MLFISLTASRVFYLFYRSIVTIEYPQKATFSPKNDLSTRKLLWLEEEALATLSDHKETKSTTRVVLVEQLSKFTSYLIHWSIWYMSQRWVPR